MSAAVRLPSGSEMERAEACPASFSEPGIYAEADKWTDRGETVHVFLRRVLGGDMTREQALEHVPTDDPGRELCERLNLDKLPRGGDLEVAMAIRIDEPGARARILGRDIDRQYEAHGADRALDVVATGDYIARLAGRRAVVADYKSGYYVTGAANNAQLGTLAVMVADVYDADEVDIAIVRIGDGEPRWDIVTLGELELAAARGRLRSTITAVRSAPRIHEAQLVEGKHCRYCPVWKRCPAKIAALCAISSPGGGLPTIDVDAPREVIAAQVAQASELLDRYDAAAKVVRAEMEAYVRLVGPIQRRDGKMIAIAPGRPQDKVTNAAKALELVAEQLDEESAAECVQTTKGAIEEAARQWAKRNDKPIGKTQEGVLEVLRKEGAIAKVPGEEGLRVLAPAKKIEGK